MEQRQIPDRRRHPRGGRRQMDVVGFTPLVMVVDEDDRRRELSEAILARLRFAVAPVTSVAKAIAVLQSLRPEIVVASEHDAQQIREGAPAGHEIPIVSVGNETRTTEALIQIVRCALRARVPQS